MAKTIAGAGSILVLVFLLVTVPIGLIFLFGIPQISPVTSIVVSALVAFLVGILNQKFVHDIIIIAFLNLMLYLSLTLVATIDWRLLLLVYVGSFIISKKVTPKRKKDEYKLS